jgi:hypothetical protein
MGNMAVLLFDSGKKRIKSSSNFATLMPIGKNRTNHRTVNHLAAVTCRPEGHSNPKKWELSINLNRTFVVQKPRLRGLLAAVIGDAQIANGRLDLGALPGPHMGNNIQ